MRPFGETWEVPEDVLNQINEHNPRRFPTIIDLSAAALAATGAAGDTQQNFYKVPQGVTLKAKGITSRGTVAQNFNFQLFDEDNAKYYGRVSPGVANRIFGPLNVAGAGLNNDAPFPWPRPWYVPAGNRILSDIANLHAASQDVRMYLHSIFLRDELGQPNSVPYPKGRGGTRMQVPIHPVALDFSITFTANGLQQSLIQIPNNADFYMTGMTADASSDDLNWSFQVNNPSAPDILKNLSEGLIGGQENTAGGAVFSGMARPFPLMTPWRFYRGNAIIVFLNNLGGAQTIRFFAHGWLSFLPDAQ